MKTNLPIATTTSRRRASLLAGSLVAILAASSAQAANLYWAGNSTNTAWGTASYWSTAYNNYTSATAAPGSGDLAVFNRQALNTAQVVNLNAAQAAQGLYFSNTGTTLLQGGGTANQTLTLGNSGIQIISANTSAGAVTIGSATANQAVNISLAASQSWKNNSSNLLTIVNGVSSVSGATTLTINSFISTSVENGVKFNGVISDGGGTTALTIATGTGVIANGITTLTAANTYTGATTVQSGQLLLDFSATGAPTGSGIINNAAVDNSTGSALVLGGGARFSVGGVVSPATLTLKGLGSGTNTQYFHNTTLQAGDSAITLTQNGATSLTASLGTITRNANATLNFSVTPLASGIVATTANANDGTGILGNWVSTGAATTLKYATVNGSNQIVAYTGTAAATSANLTDTTGAINYDLAVATGSTPATVSANTIRFYGPAATTTLGANFTVNGLMNAGSGNWTISTNALTIGANQELVILGNAQSTTINSTIKNNGGGASGLTYAGGGALTLNGASTYNGTTTLNAGTIIVGRADVAGVSGALGNGGNITFSGGTLNYASSAAAADYSTRFKNSTSAISIYAANHGVHVAGSSIILGGVIDSSNTGGLVVTGAEGYLTINGANTYSGDTILVARERISLGSGKAFSTGTVFSNDSTIFSASTDLTGVNALANDFKFAGTTTSFIGANSIELGGKLSVMEATQQRGFANNITHGTLTLSGGINISSGAASALQMYIYGIGTTNVTGVIADNALGAADGGNIAYYGAGTLSMSAANTYTGNTILAQGGGTLKLDFSAAGAPVNNIILSTSGAFQMTIGGGTLNLVGSATQDNSQTFTNGMTFGNVTNGGGAGAIVMTPNGHNLVLNAGAITAGAGSVTDITLSGASTATNGVTTTNVKDAGELIKYFTVGGNDWATKGSGASAGNIVAYSGYNGTKTLNTWAAASGTVNFSNNATADYTGALGNNTTVNTVRFDSNVASGFDLGTNQLTVNDGILVTGNVSGKALTISNGSLTSPADLVIINNGVNDTTLDISANLTNTAVITKSGQGLVSLSGTANTFGGRVSLDQGVLKVADAVTTALSMATSAVTTASNTLTFTSTTSIVDGQQVFGAGIASGVTVVSHTATTAVISGSAVTLASGLNIGFGSTTAANSLSAATNIQLHGGVLGLTSDFTRSIGTGPGQLSWGASGGFAAYGADRNVNIGGNATPTAINWTTNLGDSSILTLGASSADAMVTVLNPINMERQSQTIKVDNGSAAIDARLSGVVSASFNGLFGLTKTGLGTLQLNAANSYNGITQVLEGTLSLSATGSIASGSQLIVDGPTAVFDLGNNKNQTSTSGAGGVILDNGGSITGTGTSTLTGQAYDFRSGTVTAILGNSAATTLAPVTTLTKTTSGTVTLTGANTYQGATTISAGTLLLSGSGSVNASSGITVSSGATLGGNPTTAISNAILVQDGGSLMAGLGAAATGTLTSSSSLTMGSGAADNTVLVFSLGGGLGHSTLARTGGTWVFDANQKVSLLNIGGAATIGIYTGLVTGLASDVFGGASSWTVTNARWEGTFSYNGGAIDLNLTAVPEPATWALLAFSLTTVMVMRRRRE